MVIIHSLYQLLGIGWLALATIPALFRGGWPERAAAGAMIAAWLLSGVFQNGLQIFGVQVGVMVIDIALLVALLVVALTSDRWWPMWSSGFHGLSVLLHFAVLADPQVWGRAYFIAGSVFSFLTLLPLFIGTMRRWRERRAASDVASPLT
jgi:hypothetical protein